MKRMAIAVILALLGLLLVPSAVTAASGIQIVNKTGDGAWTDDTWQVEMFPGEAKATTISLYNSSSSSLSVDVSVSPDSLDGGNLTFELDKPSFEMPSGSHIDVTLTVKANGSATPGTYTAELEIKSEVAPTPPPPPIVWYGGGEPSVYYVSTDYCGLTETFRIDRNGKVLQAVEAGCKGGALTVTIEKGTIALDKNGKPLSTLTMKVNPDPPPPPEGANIIGLPYLIGPSGATFDPPLTFTWTYDPADLPEGVAEEDLVLAYYNKDKGEWVELECVVDTEKSIVTAKVSHFTTFAIIGAIAPPPVPPPPAPPEPEKPEPVVPEPTKPEPTAPSPEEPAPEKPTPWPWIGGGIGAAAIAGGAWYWLWRRRREANHG